MVNKLQPTGQATSTALWPHSHGCSFIFSGHFYTALVTEVTIKESSWPQTQKQKLGVVTQTSNSSTLETAAVVGHVPVLGPTPMRLSIPSWTPWVMNKEVLELAKQLHFLTHPAPALYSVFSKRALHKNEDLPPPLTNSPETFSINHTVSCVRKDGVNCQPCL